MSTPGASREPRPTWALLLTGALLLALHEGLAHAPLDVPHPTAFGIRLDDLIIYLLLPAALLPLFGEHPLAYLRLGRVRRLRIALPVSAIAIIASIYALAQLDSFRRYYGAGSATPAFALRSLLAIATVEFFFRGFLLQRPYRTFGWIAAVIATVPYCLIHAGKPMVELYGSIVFGVGLAYLAAQSGSIWYGVLLHWLLATGAVLWIAAQ